MSDNLILVMVALSFLLVILVFSYVYRRTQKVVTEAEVKNETFETYSATILNRASSSAQLHHACDSILSHYGTINARSISSYRELVEALCTHPHTDSKLILRFEKTLRSNNAAFADEIEHSLRIGLAARG